MKKLKIKQMEKHCKFFKMEKLKILQMEKLKILQMEKIVDF